jgi:glycerophosphoryl diester phosphodiesterase
MEAAFAAGADVVELNVHLTPEKTFAAMHDWTADCRTEGKGVTEELGVAYLKTLDISYGYTADGGTTFSLRGKGVGLLPTLDEVLPRFPDKQFPINYKSRRAEEGDAFAKLVAAHPEWRNAIWGSYGGSERTDNSLELIDGLRGYTNKSILKCVMDYELAGWTCVVPGLCRNTIVVVPPKFAWAVWGWPHKFACRMEDAGSTVILLGPLDMKDVGSTGIDRLDDIKQISTGFAGNAWTNRKELIGPELRKPGR